MTPIRARRACRVGLPTAALLLSLTAMPAAAQRTIFNPSFTLGQVYTDDVGLGGATQQSDSYTRLSVILPVEREWPTGSLSFRYQPTFERFSKLSALDNTGHRGSLAINTSPSRLLSFGLRAAYSRDEQQSQLDSVDPADLFLLQRFLQERASGDLRLERRVGPRWQWNFAVGAANWRFTPLEDVPPETSVVVENRKTLTGEVGFQHDLSRRTSVGFRYGFRRFELELSGEQSSHLASFVVGRSLGERTRWELAVGGFRSNGQALAVGGGPDTRTGAQGTFSFSHDLPEVRFGISASHGPSAGGARAGTSVNSVVALNLSDAGVRKVHWDLFTRFARRDPSDPAQSVDESISVGGALAFEVQRLVDLSLSVRYIDQTSGRTDAAGSSYYRAGLSLVLHPLGRTRLGGSNE